jgi:aspartyl-tRNA(Asn)/glutamyl-tRNA(Gln) amidotransferase subunit A
MIYPPPVESLLDSQSAFHQALGMTRNTQPGNYLDLCAASIPLPMNGYDLPAGLQIMCPPGQEHRLLSIALAIDARLGRPQLPADQAFLRDC